MYARSFSFAHSPRSSIRRQSPRRIVIRRSYSIATERANDLAAGGDICLTVEHGGLHASLVFSARVDALQRKIAVLSDALPRIVPLSVVLAARVELAFVLLIVLFA